MERAQMETLSTAPGSPIYVPSGEVAAALSLGAEMAEGDARLRIPSPLPQGVMEESFLRWTSVEARIVWLSEYLETIVGAPVDLGNVAGIIESAAVGQRVEGDANDRIPLYVPSFDFDTVRAMPGVSWDRRRRVYVADRTADYGMIYPYLTPSMRSIWIADRNLEVAMASLVRARAMQAALSRPGDDSGPEMAPRALRLADDQDM
jgi:hypothetical protein